MEIIEKALQVCKEKEKEKKFSELEVISEQILKIDPENVPAKYFFALSKKRLDKYDEYLEALEKIKNISVKKSELNTALGALCLDLEEIEESLSFHKKAIKLDKNNDDAWSKLGNCYNLTKQYRKAIKCLKKCHKLNKKNEECLIILSVVYLNLKKINKTIYYLKKAIELNKKSSAAKFNLGCALLAKENNKQGWKYYAHRFENFGYFKEMPKDKFLIGKKISRF
jgi:tetratricopeptide (TPR) repeat protein